MTDTAAPEPPAAAVDVGLTPEPEDPAVDQEDAVPEDAPGTSGGSEGTAATQAVIASLITTSSPRPSVEDDPAFRQLQATMLEEALDAIDTAGLALLPAGQARRETREAVVEFIRGQDLLLNASEERKLIDHICNRILGD
jgi:hypothetical protein